MYIEKISCENRLKHRALRNIIMLLLMTSLAKERETGVNACLVGKFMKWLYERANHVINDIYALFSKTKRHIVFHMSIGWCVRIPHLVQQIT